jgi:P-type Ca2+ transporter type 2C
MGEEKKYYALPLKEILKSFKVTDKGLSKDEAEHRLHKYGFNEVRSEHKISPIKIFLEQFSSPLIWILIFALVVSIFLSELADAIIIGIIIILNAILGFIQEYKAERAIEALQQLASPKAKVIRDGREIKIDSKNVVPGDIIVLDTGDKIPADARLIENHDLRTEEGPLTGESQPVSKELKILAEKTVLADRINMVYSSTIISNGRGKAVVAHTGMNTEVGKIASLIKEAHEKKTPLQKKLRELGKYLTIAVVAVAIVVFLAGLIKGESATVMFLTAIALAVAAIPEGLPAVITISLSLGVQRMIKRNALVRKLPSVETLGSVNVICTDKTGTLTHNEMTVKKIWFADNIYEVSGSGYEAKGTFMVNKKPANPLLLHSLLKIGALCNDALIENNKQKKQDEKSVKDREVTGDPTEAALIVSAEKARFTSKDLNKKFPRVDEITFSSERKMMTTIHQIKDKKVSYTKGAPDIIIEKCNRILVDGKVIRLNRHKKKEIIAQNETFADDALRVLGFAYNDIFSKKEDAENDMIFVGLQAMIDPPREEVKQAIKRCQSAGIRVIMITGDQIATAKAIAKEIGIKGEAIHGQDLENGINLNKEINKINIFARVNPEHKLKIVEVLKKKGYVVAMTGDGVNDAPALKKADIGISMGIMGTDVAKEASDMILTDDNFTSIVNAVEEGRGIFDNIRKFVNYLLSSNLGEIVLILLATLMGLPLPLTAIHILWVNLVTDGLPAVALGVDPYQKEIMKRKPRAARESIISKEMGYNIGILGTLLGIIVLVLFWLYLDSPLAKAQTVAFTALVVFEIVRLQVIRSEYKLGMFSNKWLVMAVLSSFMLQLLVIYTPLSKWFGTVALGWIDWLVIAVGALVLYLVSKLLRWIFRLIRKRK